MADRFPGLVTAYIAGNSSHRAFRVAIANAKALAFILANRKPDALGSFLAEAEEAKRSSPDGRYALGLAGRATTTTIQLAIHLTGNEIDLITAEPGGFVAQAFGLVYREVYRVLETYLIDLFEEIALRHKHILYSERHLTHEEALRATSPEDLQQLIIQKRKGDLTRVGFTGLEKAFADFGLPIVPLVPPPPLAEQQSTLVRLRTASAIRNLIEHNRGVVDSEFLMLMPDSSYKLGDRVVISTPELGDALSAVEWTADQLNRRAVEKFSI